MARKKDDIMLSYWFPTPLEAAVPLVFAIGFAVLAAFAVVVTRARRPEEPDANLVATFYVIGFGLAALSEVLRFVDIQFGWSLAAGLSISGMGATILAVLAAAVAGSTVAFAAVVQFQEEDLYRIRHAHTHNY